MKTMLVEPKRGTDVGRVMVEVIVKNVDDLRAMERGERSEGEVRRVKVAALVDSGATFFCLPQPLIDQLGLPFNRDRQTRPVAGVMNLKVFGSARIEVQGRACDVEVLSLPGDTQPLLGQLPLEALDFWVDPVNQRLVGNPEHGGQWMAEVY